MSNSEQYEEGQAPAQKVSVSMPADRVAAVKARVGSRGFSAYVSAAVERQIQRDLIEELLQANEAEAGPVPREMRERAEQSIRAAKALAAREQGTDEEEGQLGKWHGREAS
ncbi:hypothetical protein PV396_34230 [Streptomyces sp. ME02-8801-2C]|uniref:hypothetical protein n=1 Tax=Streptomyces sp. ME02-8801-2C TaxID=3028680 RepID=UPI0029B29224|nr:hypothetical protein [Streptomyces sp. ME02-8801-2C]MDX3456952.1 hypothetical protein [Streptomyces sp. ME02-8801-2C]